MRESSAVFKGGRLDIKVIARAPYIGYKSCLSTTGLTFFQEAFDAAYTKHQQKVMSEKVKDIMLKAEEKERTNKLDIRKCKKGTTP